MQELNAGKLQTAICKYYVQFVQRLLATLEAVQIVAVQCHPCDSSLTFTLSCLYRETSVL